MSPQSSQINELAVNNQEPCLQLGPYGNEGLLFIVDLFLNFATVPFIFFMFLLCLNLFLCHQGLNFLYPGDLIPFTRKPLFLVIDSNVSDAFKAGLLTLMPI